MLSNAYFLAKFCFDTAENEPATSNFANFANLTGKQRARSAASSSAARAAAAWSPSAAASPASDQANVRQIFGCIGTDLCKQVRVLKHFSKSTRLSS